MKVIALEEHFMLPADGNEFPPGAHPGNDREIVTGLQTGPALLEIGEKRLADMNRAGIDIQVLSLNQPGCQALVGDDAVATAMEANDYLFEKIKNNPKRFVGLASLPTSKPGQAAKELGRAVAELNFKGAVINGHTGGEFLDHPKYWDIFAAAQDLRVPIYLHPREPHPAAMNTYFEGYRDLAFSVWGFALDTCSHFLRIVLSGALDQFPDVTLILGHLGEGIPFWFHRMTEHTRLSMKRRGLEHPLDVYLRRNLAITCSGNFSVPAILCSVACLGAENIMFAVDWPYEENGPAVEYLRSLPLSSDEIENIAYRNAERLLHL